MLPAWQTTTPPASQWIKELQSKFHFQSVEAISWRNFQVGDRGICLKWILHWIEERGGGGRSELYIHIYIHNTWTYIHINTYTYIFIYIYNPGIVKLWIIFSVQPLSWTSRCCRLPPIYIPNKVSTFTPNLLHQFGKAIGEEVRAAICTGQITGHKHSIGLVA